MKKHQIVLLALAAVFALSAVLAATASAEATLLAEWLFKAAPITTLTATETKGKLILLDEGIGAEVECEGTLDGSVGANGEDEITEVLSKAGAKVTLGAPLTSCVSLKGCEAAKAIELSPAETLPWHSLLYLDETTGSFLDTIFQAAGFEIVCTILDIKATDTCTMTGETSTLVNQTAGAEATGLAEPAANCTIGGTAKGRETYVAGNKITNTKGEAILVSE